MVFGCCVCVDWIAIEFSKFQSFYVLGISLQQSLVR